MNYGELRTNFVSLLNRRDLTPTLRDTFIQQGIARIQRTLRIPAMEQGLEATWGQTTKVLPIPDDLIELRSITCGTEELERVNIQRALRASQCVGTPKVYAARGGAWVLGPTPTVGTVIRVDYYGEFSPLSQDSDVNDLSMVAPDLILDAAMTYGCKWALDERLPTYEESLISGLSDLQTQALRDELTANATVTPAFCFPED